LYRAEFSITAGSTIPGDDFIAFLACFELALAFKSGNASGARIMRWLSIVIIHREGIESTVLDASFQTNASNSR
jgi:hypothetical protein